MMRFKMNAEQHEALYNLFKNFVIDDTPANDGEKLLHSFMQDVYEKLRKKMKARMPKDWSLTLTDKETLAYKIYWQQAYLDAEAFVYEQIIINQQLHLIDKQHG